MRTCSGARRWRGTACCDAETRRARSGRRRRGRPGLVVQRRRQIKRWSSVGTRSKGAWGQSIQRTKTSERGRGLLGTRPRGCERDTGAASYFPNLRWPRICADRSSHPSGGVAQASHFVKNCSVREQGPLFWAEASQFFQGSFLNNTVANSHQPSWDSWNAHRGLVGHSAGPSPAPRPAISSQAGGKFVPNKDRASHTT